MTESSRYFQICEPVPLSNEFFGDPANHRDVIVRQNLLCLKDLSPNRVICLPVDFFPDASDPYLGYVASKEYPMLETIGKEIPDNVFIIALSEYAKYSGLDDHVDRRTSSNVLRLRALRELEHLNDVLKALGRTAKNGKIITSIACDSESKGQMSNFFQNIPQEIRERLVLSPEISQRDDDYASLGTKELMELKTREPICLKLSDHYLENGILPSHKELDYLRSTWKRSKQYPIILYETRSNETDCLGRIERIKKWFSHQGTWNLILL